MSFKLAVISNLAAIVIYLINWRFLAYWWFILVFVNSIALLLYIAVIVNGVDCWARHYKRYTHPYLPLSISLICLALFYFLPPLSHSKSYHKTTARLSARPENNCHCNLYVDTYCIYKSGATTTDLDAVYITDLKNFSVFVGEYDEGDEQIEIYCFANEINTAKISFGGINLQWSAPIVLERKKFIISELLQQQNF